MVDSTKDKTSSGAGPVVVEVPTNEGVEDRGTAGDEEGEAVNEADGDREEEKIEEDEVQSEREPRAQEWQELNMEPQVDVQVNMHASHVKLGPHQRNTAPPLLWVIHVFTDLKCFWFGVPIQLTSLCLH